VIMGAMDMFRVVGAPGPAACGCKSVATASRGSARSNTRDYGRFDEVRSARTGIEYRSRRCATSVVVVAAGRVVKQL